ncbi:hypothetical protein H6G00_01455 [Leptolyngbya sp. FACHB-541]|uniref:hypothetical protein n=1 Tax=Leptolyngbya sp. FACHB-541 TaxID=2692810 RepID=UPI001687C694|nr:hypothetical protein [Leptolyngbya sp. FACHB-541]MBD1995296.1 hypothetical protein [Leptolyngbya sp. FACHB-541]
MSKFLDLLGTSFNQLRIGLKGVSLKNSSGNLAVRNAGDTADAELSASIVRVSGDFVELNSDAAGAGSDRKYGLARTGAATQDLTLILPNVGTAGQVLAQKSGSPAGVIELEFIAVAGTSNKVTTDTTTLAFGSAATVPMFQNPTGSSISAIRVIIDVPFNGTPSMSIGTAASPSKYLASTQVDLTFATETIFEVFPGKPPATAAEDLIISYSANGATAGSARIEVAYSVPS